MRDGSVISYSGSYSITGRPCTLNVLEVDMDVLHSTSEGLSWPATVSRPEGVMIWSVVIFQSLKTRCSAGLRLLCVVELQIR